MDVFLHDYPGEQLRFERSLPEPPIEPHDLAKTAIAAIDLFCQDFVSPLSVDLGLAYCEAEYALPVDDPTPLPAYWFLRLDRPPPGVLLEEAWTGAVRQETRRIDRHRLADWVGEAMKRVKTESRSSDPAMIVGWREILVRAVRVRLLDLAKSSSADEMHLRFGAHRIDYPIQREGDEAYATGPLEGKAMATPLELKVSNDGGVLAMDINLLWSLWTDPHWKGFRQVHAASRRLEEADWVCTFGSTGGGV